MQSRTVLSFLAGAVFAVSLPAVAQNVPSLFPDVRSDAYFSAAISEMANLGIIRGYDNGRFGPNDSVTRAQIAVLFQRYDQTAVEPLRIQLSAINQKLGLQCGAHLVGDTYPSSDGCNTCSCTEKGEVCTLRACAASSTSARRCAPYVCADGSVIPSCSADGHVLNYFAEPCFSDGGYASSHSSISVSCDQTKAAFNNSVQNNNDCNTDADCTIFEASCPFITCGTGINVNERSTINAAADALRTCMERAGNTVCASCLGLKVSCISKKCTVQASR